MDCCFAIEFRVSVICRAGRDQINCKTKFDVQPHTVELLIPTFYGAPHRKKTTFHYEVKEREQIKTVFAQTVDSGMSC